MMLLQASHDDRLEDAWELIHSLSDPAFEASKVMATLELQARLRRQNSEPGLASVSGSSGKSDLAATISDAFRAMGHTMSCASEMRSVKLTSLHQGSHKFKQGQPSNLSMKSIQVQELLSRLL